MSTTLLNEDFQLSATRTYHVGALESAAHRTLRQYKDRLLKPYGLSSMEWYIIGIVADAGAKGIRSTDLAATLGTTMAFITKTINLLVAKGILVRQTNEKDARSTFVTLDDSYQSTLAEIEAHLRKQLRADIYSKVSREELATYIKVLQQFTTF